MRTNKTNKSMQEQLRIAEELFKAAQAAVLKNNEVYSLINELYHKTKEIVGTAKDKELFRYSSFDYATSHIMAMLNASVCNPDNQREILKLLNAGMDELMVFKKTRPYWFEDQLTKDVRSSKGDAKNTFALMYRIMTNLGINLSEYKILISEERMEQMYHYIETGEKLPLKSDTLITKDTLIQ